MKASKAKPKLGCNSRYYISPSQTYLAHTGYSWFAHCWFDSSLWDTPEVQTCRQWDNSTPLHRVCRWCLHCWHSSQRYTAQGWSWDWHRNIPRGRGYRLCLPPMSSIHWNRQILGRRVAQYKNCFLESKYQITYHFINSY